MDNILGFVGRFFGEKIALLDKIYAKKGEVGAVDRGVNFINGYSDALPPRPVLGDKYVIKGGTEALYVGVYYLNFGFNQRDKSVFKVVGDAQAQATGARRLASLAGAGVRTGHIPIRAGASLMLHVGIDKVVASMDVNVSVEEYNAGGGLIQTGALKVGGYERLSYVPDANTVSVVLHVKGSGGIRYIKVWDSVASVPVNFSAVYCWNGSVWEERGVPAGGILRVKGRNFGLMPVGGGFCKVNTVHLPKLEIKGGLLPAGDAIRLLRQTDQEYVVRLYVKRRRIIWVKAANKCMNRTKYYECLRARIHNNSIRVYYLQSEGVVLSRKVVESGSWFLPYTWKNLVALVFTIGSSIRGKVPAPMRIKFYPSTGFSHRNKHDTKINADYADFALCFAKRIGGEWVEGERCYFRLAQKKGVSMEDFVTVRVL